MQGKSSYYVIFGLLFLIILAINLFIMFYVNRVPNWGNEYVCKVQPCAS